MTKKEFNGLIFKLKQEGYHVFYSKGNWCWVSYKDHREKLTVDLTHQQFQDKLYWMQPVFKK